jgi:hypothetical protein
MDPLNLKKALRDRMAQAEGETASEVSAPAPAEGMRFGKQFSPEEKKAQAQKLASMLRKRE